MMAKSKPNAPPVTPADPATPAEPYPDPNPPIDPRPSPDTVASLLALSRAAHQAALQARQVKHMVEARRRLQEAADTRQRAHDLDPAHTAQAWSEGAEVTATPRGRNSHADLMAFYRQQLGEE